MLDKADVLEYMNAFGSNLRGLRNRLGISYDQMAQKTGISKSILSRTENGHTAPAFETLLRLHLSYGVDATFFGVKETDAAHDADAAPDGVRSPLKFNRRNFTGRPALSAEMEVLGAGDAIHSQIRRRFEETILVLSGDVIVTYTDQPQVEYPQGSLFTLNPNHQGYDIATTSGATFVRISCPLARDRSSIGRYQTVTHKLS